MKDDQWLLTAAIKVFATRRWSRSRSPKYMGSAREHVNARELFSTDPTLRYSRGYRHLLVGEWLGCGEAGLERPQTMKGIVTGDVAFGLPWFGSAFSLDFLQWTGSEKSISR